MLGWILAGAAFLADAAVVAATHSWPLAASALAVYAMLGLTWALSVVAFCVLRRSDGGGGGGRGVEDPEPPWWPEFERQLRDYMRGRPSPPSRAPRTPAGAGRSR